MDRIATSRDHLFLSVFNKSFGPLFSRPGRPPKRSPINGMAASPDPHDDQLSRSPSPRSQDAHHMIGLLNNSSERRGEREHRKRDRDSYENYASRDVSPHHSPSPSSGSQLQQQVAQNLHQSSGDRERERGHGLTGLSGSNTTPHSASGGYPGGWRSERDRNGSPRRSRSPVGNGNGSRMTAAGIDSHNSHHDTMSMLMRSQVRRPSVTPSPPPSQGLPLPTSPSTASSSATAAALTAAALSHHAASAGLHSSHHSQAQAQAQQHVGSGGGSSAGTPNAAALHSHYK